MNFTSERATVATTWQGYGDYESGVRDYTVTVIVNQVIEKRFPGISNMADTYEDHSLGLTHGDTVQIELVATNR